MNKIKQGYDRLRGKQRSPSVNWLRPKKGNAQQMIEVAQKSLAQGHSHIEFMLHSSEFMPGGSPTFRTEQDIDESLYNDLETLFNFLQDKSTGNDIG